ncbi:sigma-70 family RNA polymerase sigma factor [Pedobacter rhizosphaerae]|uniref:sigma-70 family RNA polymerase sigma factor n=1 Tax=Pedobacter rhizosphaerae TaxID=390241 RepID=UPI001FDFB972|nr:sigma-70 family RNA polymerase sigma factor [Pedobacter rhizosphaerae]
MTNTLTDFSDDKLIDLLNDGDRGALDEIYRRHWSAMYIASFNMLKDHDACMDINQDIFTWLWTKRGELKITSLKSYLLSAVRYKVTDVIRRVKVGKVFLDHLSQAEASFDNVTSDLEVKELRKIILQFIADLPDRCREVFDLSRNHHLSNKEIALRLGITEKAVERQMTIALKRFKSSIGSSYHIFIGLF